MSFIFLALRAHNTIRSRSFHSAFTILDDSHLKIASQYEKQYDHPAQPIPSHFGYRTYMVSEPDASTRHYQVPAGAYHCSASLLTASYINLVTPKPSTKGEQHTSTGGSHFTTRAASSTSSPQGRD
jgi:hypothetical protein